MGLFIAILPIALSAFSLLVHGDVTRHVSDDTSVPLSSGLSLDYHSAVFDPYIGIRGRYVVSNASGTPVLAFDWPCVTITASFVGSKISAVMNPGFNNFVVIVDGSIVNTVNTTHSTPRVYPLWEEDRKKDASSTLEHTLELVKITEASLLVLPMKVVEFMGLVVERGHLVSPPRPHGASQPRRLEVFGDSDSNGFGIDGVPDHLDCWYEMERFENCNAGYARTIAKSMQAQLHVEAWSGKGVVKNAVSLWPESSDPMPKYWNRALATQHHSWNFTSWIPHGVIVYLGSNDYTLEPYPSNDEFIHGYVEMLKQIIASYGGSEHRVKLINVCGGVEGEDRRPCSRVFEASNTFRMVQNYSDVYNIEIPSGLLQYPKDFGCIGHRNVRGQRKLAQFLEPKVKSIMGW